MQDWVRYNITVNRARSEFLRGNKKLSIWIASSLYAGDHHEDQVTQMQSEVQVCSFDPGPSRQQHSNFIDT